jgi:Zn-dependent protease with chaperone function
MTLTPDPATTETSSPVLDPQLQKKAKEYARIHRRLWLVDILFSGLYAILWLVTGWSVALRPWLETSSTSPWFVVAGYAAVFGGLLFLVSLPLSYYSGFILPHRFDQSTQTLRGWIGDQAKGLLIGVPIGLILLELLYLALRVTGDAWWLWAAAGLLVFSVILGNLAPVLIMPLFNKYVPLGEEHADLAERLIRLAERAHTRVRGVYKFDLSRRTKAANAALTGIGNTRRIILGDTLISEFTPDEIETVLAHELGHHVHRDLPILIAIGTVTSALGLYLASLALSWAATAFGLTGVADAAGLPALMLIMGAYGLLTMPLENGFSRWRESMADDYALSATGKNEAFASAFTRLANQNLSDAEPEGWVVWLFYDHPPLGERIDKARQWKPA